MKTNIKKDIVTAIFISLIAMGIMAIILSQLWK